MGKQASMKTQRTIAGRFRIEGRLGEGATAVVYAAHDIVLGREVALKVPRFPLAAEPDAIRRVTDEAANAARLQDPHIVTIYDVVEDDGNPVVVMERVDGKSLAQLLHERRALPLPEALAIGEGIARALAQAHRAGIIHRDVKPSNVLISDAGEVKLTDFGIARALASEQARLTQTGMIVGSVSYLAPEIVRGEAPTPAADVYALGIVMYQMLRGEAPFSGSDPFAIALAHTSQPVPSLRDVPGIPRQLSTLLEKMLAKDPRERTDDAQTIAEQFASWRATPPAADPLFAPTVTIVRPAAAPRSKRARSFSLPRFRLPHLRLAPVRLAPLLPVALSALLLAALLAIVFAATRPRDVAVPNLSGDAAAATLRAQKVGLHVNRLLAASRTVPSGGVIQQDPASGARVAPGSTVRLTVSSGPPLVTVPLIVGHDLMDATAIVAQKGLRLVGRPQYSDEPPNTIIAQSPAEGTTLRENGFVQAVISSGPDPNAGTDFSRVLDTLFPPGLRKHGKGGDQGD